MIKKKENNPINIYEYLGQTNNDKKKKPKFKTLQVDMAEMKEIRIDKKTIKLVKK
jgi:hypothetical protein